MLAARGGTVAAAPRGTRTPRPGTRPAPAAVAERSGSRRGWWSCCLCSGRCFPPVLGWVGAGHPRCRKLLCWDSGGFAECWVGGTARVVVLW